MVNNQNVYKKNGFCKTRLKTTALFYIKIPEGNNPPGIV